MLKFNTLIILIIAFILIGYVLYSAFKKKKEELVLKENCVYTVSMVTNITPAFKGNVKIAYQYNYLKQTFKGFALANETLGYKIGMYYFTQIDFKNPKTSILSTKISLQKTAPIDGWKSIPIE
jgi:amino acid permease